MTTLILAAGYANIPNHTSYATPGNKHAIALPPNFLQFVMKMLIIHD
jgi:hypothetical protein